MYNKKAQISDTITWFVATLVIIVILSISIFLVSSSGFFKGSREIETKQTDLLVTKSLMGYLLSDDGNRQVWNQIKDKKTDFEDSSEIVTLDKNFIQKIFIDLYKKDYTFNYVLLRISAEECIQNTACRNHKEIIDLGGLPSNMGGTKLFNNNLKIKDWGAKDKNTILELMLN